MAQARELAEQAAILYETALGQRHPHALYTRTNLAIVLRRMGRAEVSRRHDLVAWEALQRLVGPHQMLTLTCAINLASDRPVLSDHQGAFELDVECVKQCREVAGLRHPTTLARALNLAFDLAALRRTEESERLFSETLAAYQAVLGAYLTDRICAMRKINNSVIVKITGIRPSARDSTPPRLAAVTKSNTNDPFSVR